MNSLTKSIFSGLATILFIFLPIERIELSNANNSLYKTSDLVREYLDIKLQNKLLAAPNNQNSTSNQENHENLNIPQVIESWTDAILSILLVSVLVILLLLLFGLLLKSQGTIVLPFDDLRETNNNLQEKTTGKPDEENKFGKIISEILVAELCKIRYIYELAETTNNRVRHILQISNPNICIDANSLCNQLLTIDNFPVISKFSNESLIESIGEVNEIGPVVGKISLARLMFFLQQILPSFKSHINRNITGSIEAHKNNLRIVAHMEEGKQFWTWEIAENNDRQNNNLNEQDSVRTLVEKLAYSIVNQLTGYPINLDNFIKYIKALKSYSNYESQGNNNLQNQDKNSLDTAIRDCIDFYEAEPNDIRSFGLLYNLGIASLRNELYGEAETLFRNTISLEPLIVQRIFDIRIQLRKLKWDNKKKQELLRSYFHKKRIFWAIIKYEFQSYIKLIFSIFPINKANNNERKKLLEFSKFISYALNALGQTLERQCEKDMCEDCSNTNELKKSNRTHKSEDDDKKGICYIKLCEAKEAYKRANNFAKNDALSLSNLASLRMNNVNLLEKDTYLKESVLRKAKEELNKATDNRINENRHLAFNRLGNLHHEQGNYAKAISNYKNALDAKKDFVIAYRNLGIIYLEKKNFDKAIKKFEKGMQILTDDELFHGNIYFKHLHAWLHNAIGWTCLMQVIDNTHKNNTCINKAEYNLLTRAEHELQEAIVIFKGDSDKDRGMSVPLYVPYFNLGHVYVWMLTKKDKSERPENLWNKALIKWNEGLNEIKDNHDSILFEMLSSIYNFATEKMTKRLSEKSKKLNQSPLNPPTLGDFQPLSPQNWGAGWAKVTFQMFSKERSEGSKLDKLDKLDKRPEHWRLRSRVLDDARAVKESILHLKNNGNIDFNEQDIKEIDEQITKLENNLPSFNLGLVYLWKNEPKNAIKRWQEKIKQLKKDIDNKNNDKTSIFNYKLWLYIYEALVDYFLIPYNNNKITENGVAFVLQLIPLKILINTYPLYILHILHEMYPKHSWQYKYITLYMKIDRHMYDKSINNKTIAEIIQDIKEYIKSQDNHTIKQVCEVLDDIQDKFEILKEGPKPFQEQWASDNLKKLFDPILSYHKNFKKYRKENIQE